MQSNKQTQETYLKAVDKWLEKIDEISNNKMLGVNDVVDEEFRTELDLFLQNNTKLLNDLMNYKGSLDNLVECDDLECDLFFDDKQVSFKNKVREHLKEYKIIIENIVL